MSAGWRKLGLTLHVTASVGWLGAVLGFLALTLPALRSEHLQVVRSAYVSMDIIARFAILPLCIASLVTGVFQSLISKWGLIQHYWVAFKLLMNVLSSAVLVGHMRPIAEVGRAALGRNLARGELSNVRLQIAVDACAAVVVLLIATGLAIYKPPGITSYGWRKQLARQRASTA